MIHFEKTKLFDQYYDSNNVVLWNSSTYLAHVFFSKEISSQKQTFANLTEFSTKMIEIGFFFVNCLALLANILS